MTIEVDIVTALRAVCPRVYADVAPHAAELPRITVQFIGGRPLRWLNGTPADKRHSLVQVTCWADSRTAALQLARACETALCDAGAPFTGQPNAEPIGDVETDIEPPIYSAVQDYSIYSQR